ncbi:MAG: hypothetical protein ABII07_04190 [Patescibacteria group bacterium]|nr:hypothetical protein [Patescibacteria group bacterium]
MPKNGNRPRRENYDKHGRTVTLPGSCDDSCNRCPRMMDPVDCELRELRIKALRIMSFGRRRNSS